MKNIYVLILAVLLLCSGAAMAQSKVVTGTVSDAAGTLPGVTIMEKGTTNGVSTDGTGKFRITLSGKSNTLVVRLMGYATKEVSVVNLTNVDVLIEEDSKHLDEVVVVGFGTQRKISVTGSVSTVSREEIQATPSASLQNALTGKLPGFFSQQRGGRPGGDAADFLIRGVSTFNANANVRPLILVDDIEFSYDDFRNIDPNEVESLSVLKDASTTALYGIKGANGVILVTTRRGKAGAPRINFRTEYGQQTPTNIPEVLGSADAAILRNEALKNDMFISGGTYVPEFTDADIQKFRDGSDPYGHPNIDWYDMLYKKTAPVSKSNLDLSGGTESVTYFVSLGYETQSGLLREFKSDDVDNNYRFDRYNFRSNLDIKANKSLSFKLDLSGNNTVTNQPQVGSGPFGEIYSYEALTPFVYPVYNPDGSLGSTNPLKPSVANNIVGRIKYGGYSRARQNLINLNVSGIQKLDFVTPGLLLKFTGSIANQTTSNRSLSSSYFPSYYYDPAANTYTLKTTAGVNAARIEPYSLGYSSGAPRRQTGVQASLNYQRTFAKSHNVSSTIVANQYSKSVSNSLIEANYIPVNSRGLAGRVSYNFKTRYLAEFNGAYNGSDKFAANRRYGFFPSASAGWVISEEPFIKKNVPVLSLLKIRGAWGITGSDDLAGYKNSYEEVYKAGGTYSFGDTHTNATSVAPGSLANNQVTWEKERKVDVALEFGLFANRLSGSINFFDNFRYDILSSRNTVPSYFGIKNADLPPLNLGKVSNKGHELELQYNGSIGKDLSFNLRGNYSYAHNTIVERDEVNPKYEYQRQTGQSVGEVLGFVWDGYYTEAEAKDPSVPKYIGSTTAAWGPGTTLPGFLKYRDLNGDGVISDDDRAFVGHSNLPTTTIGLTTGLSYKNFSFNFMLQSSLNYDVQINYNYSVPFKGNMLPIHMDRWTPETASTARFPSLVSNFHGTYMTTASNSSFWAISGNFLRLKSIELGYKLPERWVSKAGIKGVRAYVSGYNLYTWSKTFDRYGVDPEVVRQSGDPGGSLSYPNQAIYNVGLNVSIK
ncbi:SusC/RagA family TonB-linked outer membrane protein [Hufsiella ginkgonis]|uniref:SusC/RagA family TonB-linked outer membrane protein n=1 Tax=Hufsiella ginkgonis TaxID=2695274 RepID=A0A7K1XSD6_9SPHI|nr:TonB-dependent receptor [Hufsiella ginkgonis]MXV13777.1 SusC/RagA family TonB-linked outer membrane protein [Hufsiella ginkgonis]